MRPFKSYGSENKKYDAADDNYAGVMIAMCRPCFERTGRFAWGYMGKNVALTDHFADPFVREKAAQGYGVVVTL